MNNVSVGGVSADLALNAEQWNRGLQQSLGQLSAFSGQAAARFAQLAGKAILEVDHSKWSRGLGTALRDVNVFRVAADEAFEQLRTGIASKMASLGRVVQTAMAGAGIAGTAGLAAFAASSVRAAASAEGTRIRLESLAKAAGHVGDAAQVAESKLAFLQALDKKASFDLPQLTDAGAALEGYKQRMEGLLPIVGDFAAAMKVDVVEAARAVGRAMVGEAEGFEVLQNMGITKQDLYAAGAIQAKSGGLALSGAGESEAAARAVLTVLERYRGGMEKDAKSIDGAFSMIASSWHLLKAEVAEPFSQLIQDTALVISTFLDKAREWVAWFRSTDIDLTRWAASLGGVGAGVVTFGTVLTTTFSLVAPPLLGFIGTVTQLGIAASVFSVLGGMVAGIGPKFAIFGTAAQALAGFATKAFGLRNAVIALGAVLGGTLTVATAGVAAAVAGLAVAWINNWGGIQTATMNAVKWLQANFTAIRMTVLDVFQAVKDRVLPVWTETWSSIQKSFDRALGHIRPDLERFGRWVVQMFSDTMQAIGRELGHAVPIFLGMSELTASALAEWAEKLRVIFVRAYEVVKFFVTSAVDALGVFSNVVSGFSETFSEFSERLKTGDVRGAFDGFAEGVHEATQRAQLHLAGFSIRASQDMSKLTRTWEQTGKDWADAVAQGLKSRQGTLMRMARELGDSMAQGMSPWGRIGAMFQGNQVQGRQIDVLRGDIAKAAAKPPEEGLRLLEPIRLELARLRGLEHAKGDKADQTFVRELNAVVVELVKARNDLQRMAARPNAPSGGGGEAESKRLTEEEIARRQQALVATARDYVAHPERYRKFVSNECKIALDEIAEDAARRSGIPNLADLARITVANPSDKDLVLADDPQAKFGNDFADSVTGPEFGVKVSPKDIQAGDYVTFKQGGKPFVGHIGVATGEGTVIHSASSAGYDMREVPISQLGGPGGENIYEVRRPHALTNNTLYDAMKAEGKAASDVQGQIMELLAGGLDQFSRRLLEIRSKYDQAIQAADPTTAAKLLEAREKEIAKVERDLAQARRDTSDEILEQALEAQGQPALAEVLQLVRTLEREQSQIWEEIQNLPDPEERKAKLAQLEQNFAGLGDLRTGIEGYARGEMDGTALGELGGKVEDTPSVVGAQFSALAERQRQQMREFFDAESEEAHRRFDEDLQLRLRQLEVQRELGQISVQEALAREAEIVNGLTSSDAQREDLQLRYLERFRTDLQQRLEIQGEYNVAELEALLAQYTAKEEIEASHVAEIAAIRQMIRDLQVQEAQDWQNSLAQIEQTFQQFAVQTLSFQTSFNQAFGNLWKSLINTIITELTKAILKLIGFQVILKGVLSLFGGGVLGSIGGGAGSGLGAKLGAAVSSGGGGALDAVPGMFHDGGMVGSWPGLAYDEVAAVLQAGEVVVPRAGVRRARQSMTDAERGGAGSPAASGTFAPTVNITVTGDVDPRAIADQVSAVLARQQRAYLQGAY